MLFHIPSLIYCLCVRYFMQIIYYKVCVTLFRYVISDHYFLTASRHHPAYACADESRFAAVDTRQRDAGRPTVDYHGNSSALNQHSNNRDVCPTYNIPSCPSVSVSRAAPWMPPAVLVLRDVQTTSPPAPSLIPCNAPMERWCRWQLIQTAAIKDINVLLPTSIQV